MFVVTLLAIAFSLAVAAKRRPPWWAASLLALGQPLLAQLVYRKPLSAGAYVAALAVGLVAGGALERVLQRDATSTALRTWAPWIGQAAWGVALLWVQAAEPDTDIDGLTTPLTVFVVVGSLWAGLVLVRQMAGAPSPAEVPAAAPTPVPAVALAGPSPAGSGWPPPAPAPFASTHAIPADLDARATPDPTAAVVARVSRGTEVRLEERRGDWARVSTANGWSGWVDGRRLG